MVAEEVTPLYLMLSDVPVGTDENRFHHPTNPVEMALGALAGTNEVQFCGPPDPADMSWAKGAFSWQMGLAETDVITFRLSFDGWPVFECLQR